MLHPSCIFNEKKKLGILIFFVYPMKEDQETPSDCDVEDKENKQPQSKASHYFHTLETATRFVRSEGESI